jgi:hypothetical protein
MSPIWIAVIVVLLILFYNYYFKHSAYNTVGVSACASRAPGAPGAPSVPGAGCESYYVHREFDNSKDAAKILEEITNRSKKLMSYLDDKYVDASQSHTGAGVDPDKSNRIDVVGGSEMYDRSDMAVKSLSSNMHNMLTPEYIQERVTQLIKNYDTEKIYEISPLNKEGNTSYTENKSRLVLCLRKKEKDERGQYALHDINTIMFVVLHELSHMMNDKWGHPEGFWVLFKFVLLNAVESGVYSPINYSLYPIKYCGLLLTYNPVYDEKL